MKIDKNKMVSLVYELRENNKDGRVIEELDESRPLNFVYGSGRLLPLFEANIFSLMSGDDFRFSLNSGQAYGERREEMIVDVPVSVFKNEEGIIDEDLCKVGNNVPMMDSDGNHLNGVINEITDEYIKMDFNHPMAGVDLFFTGKIIGVRDATPEEIAATTHSCSSCGSQGNNGCGGSCQ